MNIEIIVEQLEEARLDIDKCLDDLEEYEKAEFEDFADAITGLYIKDRLNKFIQFAITELNIAKENI